MEWGISLAFELTRVCHGGCNHSVTLGVVGRMGAVLNRVRAVPGQWVELEAPHAMTEGRLERWTTHRLCGLVVNRGDTVGSKAGESVTGRSGTCPSHSGPCLVRAELAPLNNPLIGVVYGVCWLRSFFRQVSLLCTGVGVLVRCLSHFWGVGAWRGGLGVAAQGACGQRHP